MTMVAGATVTEVFATRNDPDKIENTGRPLLVVGSRLAAKGGEPTPPCARGICAGHVADCNSVVEHLVWGA